MGIMLEGVAPSLMQKGGPHFDHLTKTRLPDGNHSLPEARVPFTTGILIGIGETRDERLAASRDKAPA